jgi:transcription termination/antitermination protein NusA
MAITEFSSALNQVATERGIPVESVIDSIEEALKTAFKKDRAEHDEEIELEEIDIDLNQQTGEVAILKDGKDVTPSGFGRIAAQTAKQVILQKIRETEKDLIVKEYQAKIGEIVSGIIFRMDNGLIVLDLGKSHAQGVMPFPEQVATETYKMNQRLKVLVTEVREGVKNTEIIVSRSDPQFVAKLFEQEVPEIASGTVEIKEIAREAGSRTKMAVESHEDKIDPVGSCVGQKGVRVQSIIAELFGEKIDIIPFSNITEKFIAASLSPAKVTEVELIENEEERRAVVSVPEDQQSLAIGKEGQNARLANKLTKWKIDIKGAAGLFTNAEGDVVVDKESAKKVVGVWDQEIKKAEPAEEPVEETPAEETKEKPAEKEVPEEKPAKEKKPAKKVPAEESVEPEEEKSEEKKPEEK